jgi:hypothetical protein
MTEYRRKEGGDFEVWDVTCPYCEAHEEVCHDDGFGYEEDRAHEQECSQCEKNFVFYTSISFDYDAKKADCLNGEEHDWQKPRFPSKYHPDKVTCSMCDYVKEGRIVWPDDQPKEDE